MTYDFVKAVDELKALKQEFVINHAGWETVALKTTLNWQKVRFTSTNTGSIPEKPGVYAFMLGSDNAFLPPFSYLIYIGIVGYKPRSKRHLRDRYREYLTEQVRVIRPLVHFFLKKYSSAAYFYFAEVDRDKYSLQEIEQTLNDRLFPPANENDYSGVVRPQAKVIWR